jgi:hypothetical protein
VQRAISGAGRDSSCAARVGSAQYAVLVLVLVLVLY